MGGIQLFKDKIKDEKISFFLMINTFLNIVILIIVLISVLTNFTKQYFLVEAEGLTLDASKRDFCSLFTNQLIEKKVSKKIITESLFDLVTTHNYQALYFEGDEKISGVWPSEDACKVLVKTKTGLRSFDYYFDQSRDFKYFYKVKKITENDFFEKENSL